MSEQDQSNSVIMRKGERVVVMNPGPLARGRLAADVSATANYAHVYWDDGTEGRPQARLLTLEDDELVEEDRRS